MLGGIVAVPIALEVATSRLYEVFELDSSSIQAQLEKLSTRCSVSMLRYATYDFSSTLSAHARTSKPPVRGTEHHVSLLQAGAVCGVVPRLEHAKKYPCVAF